MNNIRCVGKPYVEKPSNDIWSRIDSLEKNFVINFELVLDLKTKLNTILIKKSNLQEPIEDIEDIDVDNESDLYIRIYDIEKKLRDCNNELNNMLNCLDI